MASICKVKAGNDSQCITPIILANLWIGRQGLPESGISGDKLAFRVLPKIHGKMGKKSGLCLLGSLFTSKYCCTVLSVYVYDPGQCIKPINLSLLSGRLTLAAEWTLLKRGSLLKQVTFHCTHRSHQVWNRKKLNVNSIV